MNLQNPPPFDSLSSEEIQRLRSLFPPPTEDFPLYRHVCVHPVIGVIDVAGIEKELRASLLY